MLLNQISNCMIASHIQYLAGVLCSHESVISRGCSFTTCWKMGVVSIPRFPTLCVNIFTSLGNIVLLPGMR